LFSVFIASGFTEAAIVRHLIIYPVNSTSNIIYVIKRQYDREVYV
jgi:hypothetical protein